MLTRKLGTETRINLSLSTNERVDILNLVSRYNHSVDSGDADTRANTFTEDGIWDSETSGIIRGREAIREHAHTRAPHSHTWKHWTSSPIIEGDGHSATIRQYMLLLGIEGSLRPRMIGTYEDTLRREPDGWYFTYRKLITHARSD